MTARWARYYAAAGDDPRETLLAALDAFEREASARARLAVDLGCGTGRDTFELLRRGWRVLAIDAQQPALEAVRRGARAGGERLETLQARMEGAAWPAAELVNSSFALPFCPPERFPAVWARIVDSLVPGGRFAGQLFGVNDEWAGEPGMSFHARAEVDRLLHGFAVERLEEVERDGRTATGRPKHWHLFHIVARRAP